MALCLSEIYYYNANTPNILPALSNRLTCLAKKNDFIQKEAVIVCIGSDRSTGDSLGPLVGYKLSKCAIPNLNIYGTLSDPIHAGNLADKLCAIKEEHPNCFIIAVDASLGTKEHIGYITLGMGPLKPGLGVNKELPSIGDIHVTGIVGPMGTMDSFLLQTTRLSEVMLLADIISEGIILGISPLLACEPAI